MSYGTVGPKIYYVRDVRQNVGNCVSWWRANGQGYTCNLDDAGKYTEDDVTDMRDTDVPVPIEVAEAAALRHVRGDTQAMRDYGSRKAKASP